MRRILHVGLGPLGQRIVRDLYERHLGRVVAAVDCAPDLIGRDALTLAGVNNGQGSDHTVPIVEDLDSLPDAVWLEIDAAIVTTSSDLSACAPTFRLLLRHSLPVVSTCEELLWPWLRHAKLADELDTLAKSAGGRLLGTGVNPGFVMDALPVCASAVMREIDRVECHRIQDASNRRLPFQRKIGAGLTREQFDRRVQQGKLRHVGLGESMHFLAHNLGIYIARWYESVDPIIAQHMVSSPDLGEIGKGMVAGIRQTAEGFDSDGLCAIRLVFAAAIQQEDPHDRIVIQGTPPIDIVIRGGIHGDIATSAIVLNAVDRLRQAPPGLHTMASISPVHFQRT